MPWIVKLCAPGIALTVRQYKETFKWLLYGDDDTVWFVPAIKQLLKNYDPELPHAISGKPIAEESTALLPGEPRRPPGSLLAHGPRPQRARPVALLSPNAKADC